MSNHFSLRAKVLILFELILIFIILFTPVELKVHARKGNREKYHITKITDYVSRIIDSENNIICYTYEDHGGGNVSISCVQIRH